MRDVACRELFWLYKLRPKQKLGAEQKEGTRSGLMDLVDISI